MSNDQNFPGAEDDLTPFTASFYAYKNDKMVGISGNDGAIDIPLATLKMILAWVEKENG